MVWAIGMGFKKQGREMPCRGEIAPTNWHIDDKHEMQFCSRFKHVVKVANFIAREHNKKGEM